MSKYTPGPKDINNMTRTEFLAMPCRDWDEDVGIFTSLVILPTRRKHDSGYRCMDFVACQSSLAVCRLSGCSDVIHIDGICGYGIDWFTKYKGCPKLIPPVAWSIDCLYTSGLLHLFPIDKKLKAGGALSSFEIYAIENK